MATTSESPYINQIKVAPSLNCFSASNNDVFPWSREF